MKLKHHFKFNISDAKQLGIALISSYGMWAATGFQKSITGLMYPIMGFITGGLASHSSTADPNVLPESHIETPYVNNIETKGKVDSSPVQTYQNVKIIERSEQIDIPSQNMGVEPEK
jgi:hypothetical protein